MNFSSCRPGDSSTKIEHQFNRTVLIQFSIDSNKATSFRNNMNILTVNFQNMNFVSVLGVRKILLHHC